MSDPERNVAHKIAYGSDEGAESCFVGRAEQFELTGYTFNVNFLTCFRGFTVDVALAGRISGDGDFRRLINFGL